MELKTLLDQLSDAEAAIEFDDVMACVAQHYDYQPVAFQNGMGDERVENEAGQNEGSCKLFAFAQLNNLNEQQTLRCFGRYYREDVLNNPEGEDHSNIRTFMRHGWAGISFSAMPLSIKS